MGHLYTTQDCKQYERKLTTELLDEYILEIHNRTHVPTIKTRHLDT